MKIIFIGDIFGKIGRRAVAQLVPKWRKKYQPDFVIGQNENLAHGAGISAKTVREVLDAGVDAMTGGNHTFDKPESAMLLADPALPILRPANYAAGTPGKGEAVLMDKATGRLRLLVVSLIGRVFFKEQVREKLDDPFYALDAILKRHEGQKYAGTLVDFHAEATSEKNALGHYADGRVSAVLGTHTHIGTVDARVLSGGTAYVTDVGGVIAVDSVIGEKKENIVESFLTDGPFRHEPVETGLANVGAVLIDIDEKTQKARSIKRIDEQILIK